MKTFVIFLLLALSVAPARTQEGGGSLGDLARRARARRAALGQRTPVITSLDSSLDCVRNWGCLIQALEDRKSAHMSFGEDIDLTSTQGWVIHSDVRLDLQSCANETCTLLGRTENTTLTFSDARRKEFLGNGGTSEQLEQVERFEESKVKRQDEARVTCSFHPDKLKEFFERLRDANGKDDDHVWDLADHCDGLDQTITNPDAPLPAPLTR
jgi:hypothetical protein